MIKGVIHMSEINNSNNKNNNSVIRNNSPLDLENFTEEELRKLVDKETDDFCKSEDRGISCENCPTRLFYDCDTKNDTIDVVKLKHNIIHNYNYVKNLIKNNKITQEVIDEINILLNKMCSEKIWCETCLIDHICISCYINTNLDMIDRPEFIVMYTIAAMYKEEQENSKIQTQGSAVQEDDKSKFDTEDDESNNDIESDDSSRETCVSNSEPCDSVCYPFIKLTQTDVCSGKPIYIRLNDIQCIRETSNGYTWVILYGDEYNAYKVRESAKEIASIISKTRV